MREENPQENLNHTHYRDQVNKVANAVKDLIQALSHPSDKPGKAAAGPGKTGQFSKTGKSAVFLKWLLLALVIAAAGIAVLFIRNGSGEKTERSIAVLPFRLLSDEAGKQYLADGMMDAILLHLQKFSDLKVLSRTSVEQYRDTKKSVGAISKELNAGYLLEGSLQKQGGKLKLIVQLIESSKDKHLWAEEYNIEWKDVFTLQSDVAKAISEELHMKINPGETALIEKVPTKNMEAYDLYIKGLGALNEYEIKRQKETFYTSIGFFKTALSLDTTFSKAYVGLARLYISRYYWESYFKENFIDTCEVLIDKAIANDPFEEEAYYIRGMFKQFHGKFREAIADYDKTLEINPNYSDAYSYKGLILTSNLHDFAKGIMNYERALELIYGEQRPIQMRRLGRSYLDAGFVEKARSLYNAAFMLDGNLKAYYSAMTWLETSNGNFTEAVRLTKKIMEIDSTYTTDLFILSMVPGYEKEAYLLAGRIIRDNKREGAVSLIGTHRIGYAFYKAGHTQESKLFFEQQIRYGLDQIKLDRPLAQRRQAHYDLAATYAFMGEKEKAYSYLDEVDKLDFFPLWWVTLAKNDPLFEGIRKEKRFISFIQDVEAKHRKEHEKLGEWIEKKERK